MSIRKASAANSNSFATSKSGVGGLVPPTVDTVIYTDSSYNILDDLAVGLTGGYARILGANFASGIAIYLNGTQVSPASVTVVNSSEIRCILPAATLGYYTLMMFNTNNAGFMKPNSVFYSPFPTYSTPVSLTINNGSVVSQQLTASGDAPLTFTIVSGSLPTGLSMNSSGLLSGTVTGYSNNTSGSFTIGIDDAQYQSITQVVVWNVGVGDSLFMYAPLLLSADSTAQTQSFVADNSINNSQITVFGDARAQNFNPYQVGYYSLYAPTWSDYYSYTDNVAFGTGDFTVEFWGYPTTSSTNWIVNSGAASNWQIVSYLDVIYWQESGGNLAGMAGAVPKNQWVHFAFSRTGGNLNVYVNGTRTYSAANTYNYSGTGSRIIGQGAGGTNGPAYMSNVRLIKGTGIYSGATISVPTSPLLSVTGTVLLTCQHNRMIDASPVNNTFTKTGSPTISAANPFTTMYQAGAQYYSTSFNGSSDYLSIATSSNLDFGAGDFTIEAWVYPNSLASDWFLISASGSGGLFFGFSSSTTIGYGWGRNAVVWDYRVASTATVNQWQHVAVTRSGTSMYLFVNGVQQGTTQTNSTAYNLGTTSTTIGSQGANYYLNGNISNLRVLKGQALYTANFTPSTAKLTAITNTQLLTCQDSTFKDNSTNNFAITLGTTTVKPVAVSPFTPSSYTSTQITTYGSGYFDGTGDYIQGTVVAPGTDDFTMEGWVYFTALGVGSVNIFSIVASGSSSGWQVYGSSNYFWGLRNNGVNITTGTGTPLANTWYHVAVVRKSAVITLYINGVYLSSTSTVYNFTDTQFNAGYTPVGAAMTGYVSDIRYVKGTALYSSNFVPQFTSPLTNVTNTQLLTLQTNGIHNNSTFVDSSGFNNVLTRLGNATNGTFSPYGDNWSYYLGTTAMGWQTPASSHTAVTGYAYFQAGMTMTVEAWIYPISRHSGGGASFGYILGDMALAGGTLYWSIGPDSTGKLCLGWYTGSIVTCTSTNTIPLNAWTHIAVSINAGTIKLFINGNSETLIGTTSTSNVSANGSLGYVASGGYTYGGTTWQGFNGYISSVRVSKSALYSTNFTPNTTPLTTGTTTSLLVGQSNAFIDTSVNAYALTLTGVPTIQKFSPYSSVIVPKYYSTYFNGTDYVTTPASSITALLGTNGLTSTSTFTIECWIYQTQRQTLTSFPCLLGDMTYNSTTNYWSFGPTSTGLLQLFWYDGANKTATGGTTIALNTWTHIAVSISSGAIKLFVNGNLETISGTSVTTNTTGTTGLIAIGEENSGGATNGYYGLVSNLRIVKTAVYSATFVPSTSPLSVIANTSLLTFQNNTLTDSSTNAVVLTTSSTVKPLPASPFTPTASAATAYSPSVFGSSMYFDGTGDYLTAVNSKSFDLSAGQWTIECWFYQLAPKLVQLFSVSAALWRLDITAAGGADFTFNTSSTTVYPAGSFPSGQWNHIAASYEPGASTQQKSFANGKYVAGGALGPGADTTSLFYIGSNKDAAGAWDFNGYMTDVRITKGQTLYNSSFFPPTSPAVVTSSTVFLATGNAGIADQTRTNDLETVADAKVAQFSPYNGTYYSYYFDGGTTSRINTASAGTAFGSGAYTMEAWVFLTAYSASASTVFECGGTTNAASIAVTSAGAVSLGKYGIGLVLTSNNGDVSVGQWTHIAISRNSTSANDTRIFVNGVLKLTGTDSNNWTVVTSPSIGGINSAGYTMTGYISSLRVVVGTSLYNTAFTPSTSPLTAASGTYLLSCQSNKFVDTSTNNVGLTVTGTVKVQTQNPFQVNPGLSYYFDGTGDYITTHTGTGIVNFGTSDFTVECWVYFSANNATYNPFIRVNGGSYFDFGYDFSISKLQYNTNAAILSITWAPAVGQWYHMALVRSSANAKIYVNGVNLAGAGASDTLNISINSTATSVRIGGSDYTPGHVMYGYIADMRITKSARTIVVPTTPLLLK